MHSGKDTPHCDTLRAMLADNDKVTFLIMEEDLCFNFAVLFENCLLRYVRQFGGTVNIRCELTDVSILNKFNLTAEDAICIGFIVFYKGLKAKKVLSNNLVFFPHKPDEKAVVSAELFKNKKQIN